MSSLGPSLPPRSAGTFRSITRLREGWWVHFSSPDHGEAWRQITDILDVETAGIRVVRFTFDYQPPGESDKRVGMLAPATVVSLTEREAVKLGLQAIA